MPSVKPSPKRRYGYYRIEWTAERLALLGTMTDREVAERMAAAVTAEWQEQAMDKKIPRVRRFRLILRRWKPSLRAWKVLWTGRFPGRSALRPKPADLSTTLHQNQFTHH